MLGIGLSHISPPLTCSTEPSLFPHALFFFLSLFPSLLFKSILSFILILSLSISLTLFSNSLSRFLFYSLFFSLSQFCETNEEVVYFLSGTLSFLICTFNGHLTTFADDCRNVSALFSFILLLLVAYIPFVE